MAKRTVVEVTQADIDNAKPADSGHCMIADALQRALPDAERISVDLATIRYSVRKTGKRYIHLTPVPPQQNLLWFDHADPRLKPFKFKLPPAAQVVASAAGRRREKAPHGLPEKGQQAKLGKPSAGSRSVPEKRGGTLPPMGALGGGYIGPDREAKTRTGRIRRYGLRAMAR